MHLWPRKFAVLIVVALSCAIAGAQNTAELRGHVTDRAHNPIVSAFVLITGQDTSMMRAASTDDAGNFEFNSLPVGVYQLQVKADGFHTFEAKDVSANIGEVVKLDVTMGVTESVVAAKDSGASTVESSNTQLGVVMHSVEVSALPLKSRDTFELLQLQPGVQSTIGADLFYGGDHPGVVSVNGGRARSNNYNVNGGQSGDQMVNFPSIQPSPDTINEFRVISHNYDAELGRNSGSVLNVITKSGSNNFHGSVYEYLRNDALNAKGYFDSATPTFKQNQFGATLGGPIKQNRTFFFSSYEGQRVNQGISSAPVIVPTQAERSGDFSSGAMFAGTLNDQTVADMLNSRPGCTAAVAARGGAPIAAGSSYASIFPGNVIPSQCFDGTSAALLSKYVPLSNTSDGTYRAEPNARVRNDQVTLRLDHNLTGQQQMSFYYYGDDGYNNSPFSLFQNAGANVPGFGNLTRNRFQQLNLSHIWTITAKQTNEMRFVYYRNGQGALAFPSNTNLVQDSCGSNVPASQCFSDPSNAALGITPGLGSKVEGVPYISVAGSFAIGNNPNFTYSQTGSVYQYSDTYSRIMGAHTLKLGTEIRNNRMHQLYYYDVSGFLQVNGGGPNDVGYGNLIPNYLLGLVDQYSQGSGNAVDARTTQFNLFAQDAWKLKPNVTFNYGLRWEFNTPYIDAGNRIQSFRPGQATTVYPCQLSASDPLAATIGSTDCSQNGAANSVFPLGLVFPGDSGVPRSLTNNYLSSFAPRLGLAWSPNWEHGWLAKLTGGPGKSSLRLGWGLFYDSNEELVFGGNLTAQPPFGGSTVLSNVFLNTPFLAQNGSVSPNPFHGILNPTPGTPVDFALFRPITLYGALPQTLPSQYADQYHLTIQRELSRSTLLQVGYVGSQGHRLIATTDLNPGNAQTCLDLNNIPGMSCGTYGADQSYVIPANAIPAGVTLHLPYGSVASLTGPNPNPITLVGLRPYSSPNCQPTTGVGCPQDGVPVFASLFATQPIGQSSYNGLQTMVKQKFAHGVQFLFSYTWSKMMDNASSFENQVDPNNHSRSQSLSLYNATHRMAMSGYWRVPDLKPANWMHNFTDGWGLSGIVIVQSGFPIRITSENDTELMSSFAYESAGEPNLVAPFRTMNPRTSGGYYFDPSSFADAPLGSFGNSPRTICCGPGIANVDLAIHKDLVRTERANVQFRTEVFNVMNHTQFLNPNGDISSGASFGVVQGARDPRLVQFALRVGF